MPDPTPTAAPEPTPPPSRYVPPPPSPDDPVYSYAPQTPRWARVVIITLVILVGGGIVAGAVAVVSALPSVAERGNELFGPQPLASGEPGSARAVEPVECNSVCFSSDVVPETIVAQSRLDELRLTTVTERASDYGPSTAAQEYPYLASEWRRLASEQDACFFTLPGFPLATEYGTPPADGGIVEFTGTSSSDDEFSYFTQSVRLFATSAEASEHMLALEGLIAGCSRYSYDTGTEEWNAVVSPAPALDLPASVAAVGWREANALGRYYVIDLQYANLVVRTVMSTNDVVSEAQYRALVEELAAHLAELELPAGVA